AAIHRSKYETNVSMSMVKMGCYTERSSVKYKTNTTEHHVDTLTKQSAKVAFYAALTNSGDVGPYNTATVLRFSKVFTNIGKSIIYNVQTWPYNSKSHFEYQSNAVILELNAGDELYLVLPEWNTMFDNLNNHSTFSGFLLLSI
uniref:C1q domain-containing protein n=1 Tax=Lates calcarifer TaxID=8187 RepID=A0A4W6ED73_LATCA